MQNVAHDDDVLDADACGGVTLVFPVGRTATVSTIRPPALKGIKLRSPSEPSMIEGDNSMNAKRLLTGSRSALNVIVMNL